MNYNKNLINLISQLSNIQQQLVMEKDGEVFKMRANDDKLNVCFTLTAPLSYFDFPGEKIGFFNFLLSRSILIFSINRPRILLSRIRQSSVSTLMNPASLIS